ncbi:hypothetical protein [Diaphorobacter sp. MNS-0]|jgi:hypothetical protein|uniref:hypothetical protein n=1 Tax=Diaphorobacter sp. MNS-0 TaxID=2866628 RepID=UPI001C733A6E|nr:hypothetical protein [Diaphorobacter sp. MNS-0]QYY27523.1 hypothetical protein K2L43_18570 [Diaphorobacter sp. MNS-0]
MAKATTGGKTGGGAKYPKHTVQVTDPEFKEAVEKAAKDKGWAIADVYREAVREYLGRDRLREEFAEFEKRVAASHRAVTREQRRIKNDLEVMLALFDLFTRSFFLHTPAVPPEAIDLASKEAWERYEKLRAQVAQMVRAGSGVLAIAAELNAEGDGE